MHKLSVFDPTEILVPDTSVTPRKSTLLSIIEDNILGANVTSVPRKRFNEQVGHDYIEQLASRTRLQASRLPCRQNFMQCPPRLPP
jgi:DNA mismatch repair protein MSH4